MEDSKEVKMTDLVNELQILKDRTTQLENARQDQLSIAIISGDMDKIMAGMIIALAAAAMDTKVKLFFSFWGISALRDPKKNVKGKSFISKMFGMMLPKSKNKLKLSKYNMLGMSPIIMKKLMKKQGVMSIDEMFKQAGELGVEITICEMTMNLMGFKKEEMIDYPNIRVAGAATFVADAGESAMQWMI
ncbi:MAG: DsrE/DsrF/DrsH-like family protein [Dysgonamonadaceae bacterium]|mgnify:CR=1 FL=1|jgi:peroxiredoxin family protein|nr:DsrE/DsrF/DrsH-like family protein [Dysgonamonadaceae bacterium]MDD3309364.1 DsrE/DsrF/DrsH-like family protein [Dysgonamonadaceae bacterium]MDD3900369.1 DsrE/DsrF/DrsH-like family protein [Dysgonamonadaceae bacterium]MDD4399013.1 DsrE/DsrF/DrsH-like family protein [Dysgonamonadaceae bacterium]MEA5082361.1 DsrE/DsrF/DrsH-like family protein [Dysgonamonadaceae bacterium]